MELKGGILHPGAASGPLLVLTQPLSFWGGFDPATGTIIDRHHPQCGATLAGHVVAMPGSRGSGGTPAGVAEAVRLGHHPAAILLRSRDVNITIGAQVAARLYAVALPVLLVEADLPLEGLAEIMPDGRIAIT